MARRHTTLSNGRGRTTRLNAEIRTTIIRTVRAGNHLSTACAAAGVATSTFYRWMDYADRVDYAITTGQDYDRGHLVFRDFRDEVKAARAQTAVAMIDVVTRSVRGGDLIEEKPALDGAGNPIKDDDGHVMMERRWTQPDGRLALAYLRVAQPAEWGGTPSRLEVSGPGGGPVGVDTGAPTGDEITRLSVQVTAAIAQRKAIEASRKEAEQHPVSSGDNDGPVLGQIVGAT